MDMPLTETELDASPDEVWEVLTDPEGVESWLGEGSTLEPVPGGNLDVADTETGVPKRGRVEHVEHSRRLTFTWWPADDESGEAGDAASTVNIELIPSGAGTRLTVTERPLTSLGTADTSAAAWSWRIVDVELAVPRRALVVC